MFGKMKEYHMEGQNVRILFEQGEGRIELLSDRIVNVFAEKEMKGHRSKALEERPGRDIDYNIFRDGDSITIQTQSLNIVVGEDFTVDFLKKDGQLLCEDYRGTRKLQENVSKKFLDLLEAEGHDVSELVKHEYKVQVIKKMEGDETFYGLGDKTGYLNKKNYDYVMWNSDIPDAHTDAMKTLYKTVPFFITLRARCVFGIFFDNTYKSCFDMGRESPDYYYFGADGGNLDYYFIYGENIPEVVEEYTALTGRAPMPQLWTLGYQQSRWGYETREDVLEVAEGFRTNRIPCDAIHLDIDYMKGYRVFTWDEETFGEPGKLPRDLANDGFKTVAIIDPGVKVDEDYEKYTEGMRNGYFAKTPEGKTYVNAVWPGDAVYPDFGNPYVRKWWAENQRFLVKLGIRGVWNDMNEPASFHGELPGDVVFTDEEEKADHRRMHNVYGHLMAKATYEGLKEIDKRRPFVITRACYSGTQKYSTVWTGDNQSLWAHLQMAVPQLCNLGLSGFPFAGTDVGGFGADTTPELLIRWVELGCFSPLFRNHSSKGSRRQEPWLFGKEVLDIYRKYVELRYRMLPYLYDLFREEERTGAPVLRPLVFHYEKDDNVKELNDEFLFGERVLVAPVVEQGARKRMVYLPEGEWRDYWTGELFSGRQWILRDAPLDCCPMYVRAGSILPEYPLVQYVGEKPYDSLILHIFPGEGQYLHYQDNGEDFAYQSGQYNEYGFSVDQTGMFRAEILHQGYEERYRELVLNCEGRKKAFGWHGQPLEVNLKLL